MTHCRWDTSLPLDQTLCASCGTPGGRCPVSPEHRKAVECSVYRKQTHTHGQTWTEEGYDLVCLEGSSIVLQTNKERMLAQALSEEVVALAKLVAAVETTVATVCAAKEGVEDIGGLRALNLALKDAQQITKGINS